MRFAKYFPLFLFERIFRIAASDRKQSDEQCKAGILESRKALYGY